VVDYSVHIRCHYCRTVAKKKYHNTIHPYCGNCNRDIYGEKIYTCGYCGVDEPGYRMKTKGACKACAGRLDIYEPTEEDIADLKVFIAKLQDAVPALNEAQIEYRRNTSERKQ
jgi:hypothetical protein